MGVNDAAWEKLFDKYRILEEIGQKGCFPISAAQIKEFREPRLMTKFDHRVNLPAVFVENGLAILPVSRGDYVISSFAAYHDFEELSGNVRRAFIPTALQSLAPRFLVNEATALNCAYNCGILNDFLEEPGSLVPTVSGRMGSGGFSFRIDSALGPMPVEVRGSQIEIDASYEGSRFLSLFEAKRDLAGDFLIRQLYYPFRVWSGRVTKPVKTVFLVFSNGTFYLYQYQFRDPGNYNSLELVKQKNYTIATEIRRSDIEDLLRTVPTAEEPRIPFPQADRMPRIVNLMELLSERPMTKQDITSEYAFDGRQTNYYTDAGRYLGFIEKGIDPEGNILFWLSGSGRRVMGLGYRERQLAIAGEILRHRAFRDTLELCLHWGEMPDKRTVVRIMEEANLCGIGARETYLRRASTVTSWVNWILGTIQEPAI